MLTDKQEKILAKAFGQIACQAIAAKKSKVPRDAAVLRQRAENIEDIARTIKESLDARAGASAVLEKAGRAG